MSFPRAAFVFSALSLVARPAVAQNGLELLSEPHLQWADVDGDGRWDAALVDGQGRVGLYLGWGDGRFEDITQASGLAALEGASCVLLEDLDGDGDVDLFAGSATQRVWLNAGNALFEPNRCGLEHEAFDLAARALDFDSDGRADLWLRTDTGEMLARNLGGARFEALSFPAGGGAYAVQPAALASGEPSDSALTSGIASTSPGVRRLARWRAALASASSASQLSSSPSMAMSGSTGIGNLPMASSPTFICAGTIVDQGTNQCIEASSVPTLGELYPLSTNLNVSAAGNVGVGTLTPGAKLDVSGSVRASGQLVSTQATGSAPLLVSSTTKVNQLNADLLDGLDATAFSQLGSSISSSEIVDATIVDADISGTAAITGTKVIPNFGNQDIVTSGELAVWGMRTERSGTITPNVIGGGDNNTASVVNGCTIAGGGSAGGLGGANAVTDSFGTIGGGNSNTAGNADADPSNAWFATVAGGSQNSARGAHSAVIGGKQNSANGDFAVALGGYSNSASGDYACAAGFNALAGHSGSFVWSDASGAAASTAPNQFLIQASGGVGVGTTTPEGPLHVAEGSAGSISANASAAAVLERNASCFLQLLAPDANESGVLFGNPSDGAAAGAIVYNSTAADGLAFRVAGNSTKMVIEASGNVGVGTTAPTFLLHVNGSAGKPGGGSWSVASDARLKTNVAELDGALAKLLRLHGVTYEYKDPSAIHELEGEQTGFLAQEVERVFPEWVETGADGYKRLSIRGFEALTVEALRELRGEAAERAERDAQRLATLESELAELKALVHASLAAGNAR